MIERLLWDTTSLRWLVLIWFNKMYFITTLSNISIFETHNSIISTYLSKDLDSQNVTRLNNRFYRPCFKYLAKASSLTRLYQLNWFLETVPTCLLSCIQYKMESEYTFVMRGSMRIEKRDEDTQSQGKEIVPLLRKIVHYTYAEFYSVDCSSNHPSEFH